MQKSLKLQQNSLRSILFIAQTADMHRLNEKDPRYSEMRIKGAKVFKKGVTKSAIKGNDSGM